MKRKLTICPDPVQQAAASAGPFQNHKLAHERHMKHFLTTAAFKSWCCLFSVINSIYETSGDAKYKPVGVFDFG